MLKPGGIGQRSFAKSLPGTDCTFQPDDLSEYRDDPWDIRISIADAPLEEAFYYTMDDPSAASLPIKVLLADHALNASNRSRLDVDEYPDLPFLQEELIQYRKGEHDGLLKIDYFVNNAPFPGPVNLNQGAAQYLSSCAYHDHSHDYLVLDLVLLPSTVEKRSYEMTRMTGKLGELFLLRLIAHYMQQGEQGLSTFSQSPPMVAFLQSSPTQDHAAFSRTIRSLSLRGLVRRTYKKGAYVFEITDRGSSEMADLEKESHELEQRYDLFDSVGIAPPVLGIPDGFDVRVQMMEYDGLDVERSVLVHILAMDSALYFSDNWPVAFEEQLFLDTVLEALAYKTNFSCEILDALKQLAAPPS